MRICTEIQGKGKGKMAVMTLRQKIDGLRDEFVRELNAGVRGERGAKFEEYLERYGQSRAEVIMGEMKQYRAATAEQALRFMEVYFEVRIEGRARGRLVEIIEELKRVSNV